MNNIVRPFLSDETGREINETLGQIRDILLRDETTVEKKDVSFYDYDGTLLYSYTVEEANALTALPAGPAHEGLVFDGWNWSLEDVKSLTRPMDIGAMFATDDGTTRIYIHLGERTNLKFSLCVNGTVTVDWGDGTAYDTLTGTDLTVAQQTPVHNYAFPGDYVIKLAINGEAQLNENFSGVNSKWLKVSTTKIEIGENVTIGKEAFCDYGLLSNITIPSRITSLGELAFCVCRSLSSITIPSGVTQFENLIFAHCFSLSIIAVPKSIQYIGNSAFFDCISLQSITLPDLISKIDQNAFMDCTSLSNIIIPTRTQTIEMNAFSGCSLLSNVVIPDTVMHIKTGVFRDCVSLSSITIPKNSQISEIGSYAFSSCTSLSNITIPSRVTSIERDTFYDCDALLDVTIPNGVKYIMESAFNDCSSLSTVTFPDGLVSIESQAFDYCEEAICYDFTQLTSIPTLASTTAFGSEDPLHPDCEIRVPASLETQWKAATNWATYADHIVGV